MINNPYIKAAKHEELPYSRLLEIYKDISCKDLGEKELNIIIDELQKIVKIYDESPNNEPYLTGGTEDSYDDGVDRGIGIMARVMIPIFEDIRDKLEVDKHGPI